ncbi:MAG TPA: PH domain-containing protein [Aldersonia sp.]
MLLVHPVTEVVKLAPALLAALVLGTQSDNEIWTLVALAAVLAYALTRWFTTTYRVGPVHVQLRSGLFQRKVLSVPRNRIRSVDVEARVLHRVLGLAVLRVGTGQHAKDGEGFKLDGLDAKQVPALRAALLAGVTTAARRTDTAARREDTTDAVPAASPAPPAQTEIGHWSPSWVRYAPFSLTGLAVVAPVVGLLAQYGAVQWVADSGVVSGGVRSASRLGIPIAIAIGVLALLAVASAAACVRYLLRWGRLRVVDAGATLHQTSGLLTTREVTLDVARLRGATVQESLLLRSVGGAELEAIMTGRLRRQKVLPQAPRREVERVMTYLLGSAAQFTAPLRRHGRAAARRRFTRALGPVLLALVAVAIAAATVHVQWGWWLIAPVLLVAAAALAWDRYCNLGHAVLAPTEPGGARWLITRAGSLSRDRDCIQSAGIVGWTVRRSFFQRRAGVATVCAATAAGKGHYEVVDLPARDAWSLIDSVTPGAGDVWARYS